MRSSFRILVVLVATALVSSAWPVHAQISSVDLGRLTRRASSGDVVLVTTRTEGEIRGRFVRLLPDAIVIASGQGERTIAFSDIGWIEKRGDLLWNGALFGAGFLGFSMMGAAGASCSPDCDTQVPAALGVGVASGAAIGALIDWMIPGRTLLAGKRPKGSRGASDSLGMLWSRVSPGDRIGVRTTSGMNVEGRFVRASASSISVAVRNQLREIPAGEVAEVRRSRGGTQLKKGLLIGIPLGGLYGSSACYSGLDEPYPSHDSGMPCAVGVLLGAAGGGAVGALFGGSTFGSTVVYNVVPDTSQHSIALVASFVF